VPGPACLTMPNAVQPATSAQLAMTVMSAPLLDNSTVNAVRQAVRAVCSKSLGQDHNHRLVPDRRNLRRPAQKMQPARRMPLVI
jgi:hypothetical protein